MSEQQIAEKACVYAALILADEEIEVTADKLIALIKAADLQVDSIWPTIFAKALKGKNVIDLISNVGSASASAPPAAGVAAAASADSSAPAAAEEKKEEKEEDESDDDMGFGLFD